MAEPYTRAAEPQDLDNLVLMGRRYAEGVSLPLTFDEDLARETIWQLIHTRIVLVEQCNDVLSGFVFGYLERSFTVETCAYLSKFFVEKEFRGLGTSINLMIAFEKEAKRQGAKLIFTSSHTGVLFGRLLSKRCGYTTVGQALIKELT